MSRGYIAGSTDYSHQTIDDIIADLKDEIEILNATIEYVQKNKKELIESGYWSNVPDDFKNIVTYCLKFFQTASTEIYQIIDEFKIEIMKHHVKQLRNMARVAKELNIDFGRVWHQEYDETIKDYGNTHFQKVEGIYGEARDMAADMLDISNMARRVEDFIGKKLGAQTMKRKKIAFISASPEDHERIRVDKEIARIEEQLEASRFRDYYEIVKKEASKVTTITKLILDIQPEIIHFSGHGAETGIVFENDDNTHSLIPSSALEILFKNLAQKLEVLIVNSCNSDKIAEEISKNGCYAIGMTDSIADEDAINFSIGFYQALGAGTDIYNAYNTALIVMSQSPSSAGLLSLWKDGKRM
jgi:transposase-like protein